MLQGHQGTKRSLDKRVEDESTQGEDVSDKENDMHTTTRSSTPALSAKRRRENSIDRILVMVEEQGRLSAQFLEAQLADHRKACIAALEESRKHRKELQLCREAQERTSAALLEILREGLLGN